MSEIGRPIAPITYEQYRSLQPSVQLPTPQELFEFERSILVEKGLAPIGMFDHFADRLPSGLFLLVPPQPAPASKLDWYDLMERIEIEGEIGWNHLNPKDLTDKIEVATIPTMLVGVDDGQARLATRPVDSLTAIAGEGRHAYTTWRAYMHIVLFPGVLFHHGLDAVASYYYDSRSPGEDGWPYYVPYFCRRDKRPELSGQSVICPDSRSGAPSCAMAVS